MVGWIIGHIIMWGFTAFSAFIVLCWLATAAAMIVTALVIEPVRWGYWKWRFASQAQRAAVIAVVGIVIQLAISRLL